MVRSCLHIKVWISAIHSHPRAATLDMVVSVYFKELYEFLSKTPANLSFSGEIHQAITDFSPHSQFAPLFGETFRSQFILGKDVTKKM